MQPPPPQPLEKQHKHLLTPQGGLRWAEGWQCQVREGKEVKAQMFPFCTLPPEVGSGAFVSQK